MSDEERKFLAAEIRYTSFRLDVLYRRQQKGDRSVLTRQKVERLEALLSALQGHPEALGA
ncbi:MULTISPECIES: hypothetical protein [Streptomyces]|uniref:hypothetical protein n=1 Tax=Streptomyces TaxID=1883 RepID=UPI00109E7361|nr:MULTISPECIES: hypothetical protein [Streptomyces]MBX4176406.1 hypothetical protein [Streptomyces geysiriensis]THA98846.1 hypothetical protein E6R61_05735 [Streptomyces sp. LRa12]